jgi:hypothetical protein
MNMDKKPESLSCDGSLFLGWWEMRLSHPSPKQPPKLAVMEPPMA